MQKQSANMLVFVTVGELPVCSDKIYCTEVTAHYEHSFLHADMSARNRMC